MADPYMRYGAARVTDPQSVFPGYLSENSSSASRGLFGIGDLHLPASEFLPKDKIPQHHGIYDLERTAVRAAMTPSIPGGLATGASLRRLSPMEGPALPSLGALSTNLGISEGERPTSIRKSEGLDEESSMLFVEGLPSDCSRREVGHLFRPFIGFKEIRVIHRESRRPGEKTRALCFVEFADGKCARTALEALQGYKFDDHTPDSHTLKIQFARFPLRPATRT